MGVLKIGGIVAGVLGAVACAGAGAIYAEGDRLAVWAIEHPLSALIGRQLAVAGPAELDWGSPTRLVLHDFTIANAPWGAAPHLLEAGEIVLEFYPASLLTSAKRFRLVAVHHAVLSLETRDGQHNWPPPHHVVPVIAKLAVDDSAVTYGSDASGATTSVTGLGGSLEAAARDAAPTLALAGKIQGTDFAIHGTVGPLADILASAKPYPINLDGQVGGSPLSAHGTAARPLDLRLAATGRGIAGLAAALGRTLPLPDFNGSGELKGGGGDWTLERSEAKLGTSDLAGEISLDLRGKVPHLHAELTSTRLDSADFRVTPRKPAPPDGRIIPNLNLPVAGLDGIDADVDFTGDVVGVDKMVSLQRVAAALTLSGGLLAIERLHFGIAGGEADARLRLDATASPPRTDLDLRLRRIDLHALLQQTKVLDEIKGTSGIAGGFAHVSATGDTLRAALANANGQVAVFMENGLVAPVLHDLADFSVLQAIGVSSKSNRDVPVSCLIGDFELDGGVATSRTTLLDTSGTLSLGTGDFNLADETIYFDITPYPKHFTLLDTQLPVEVRGTFAKPDLRLSPMSIAGKLAAGLGVVLPTGGKIPRFVDLGLSEHGACARSLDALREEASDKR